MKIKRRDYPLSPAAGSCCQGGFLQSLANEMQRG